jgi:hypothetical protein
LAEALDGVYLLGLGNALPAGHRSFYGNDPAALIRLLAHRGERFLPAPQADLQMQKLILAGATPCLRFSTPPARRKNTARSVRCNVTFADVRNASKKSAPEIVAIELVSAIAWDLE